MGMDSIYKLSILVNMVDSLSGPAAKVCGASDKMVEKLDKMANKGAELTKTGMAITGLGVSITKSILGPIEATFETRKAIGELASLGVKDLNTVEKAAKDFATTWSGTTRADFITAAYDIKSGIASLSDEGIAQYTTLAGVTAKATKATTAEMTSLFATGYGIYKDYYSDLSDLEFGEIFAAGLSKSVQLFKTTGSGMAQAISMLGGSATTAKVPLEEQLSILGMLQATMSGSEAGTKYRQFIAQAAKAGGELGISFVDANNKLLSMPEILGRIRDKYGETIDAVEKTELAKAFGSQEAVAVIDLLYGKTDSLTGSISDLQRNMSQGVAATKQMADAIQQTEPEKYDLLKQRFKETNLELGSQLLPALNSLLDFLLKCSNGLLNFTEKHPKLTKALAWLVLSIGLVITAFGGTIAVVGGAMAVWGRMVPVLTKMKSGFDTVRIASMYAKDYIWAFGSKAGAALKAAGKSTLTFVANLGKMAWQAIVTGVQALPSLIASVWSFTAALLANPVTWIVIGIMALIAVIILLWKNWDLVTASIKLGWAVTKNAFAKGVNAVIDLINWFIEKLNLIPGVNIPVIAKMKVDDTAVDNARKNLDSVKAAREVAKSDSNSKSAAMDNVKAYASGGIITTPTLATFAERVPEAAIPIDGSARSRSLWEMTGRLSGFTSDDEGPDKPKPINLRSILRGDKPKDNTDKTDAKDTGKKTVIQKLVVSVDFNRIKDIPRLMNLLDEICDQADSDEIGDVVLEV